MSTTEDRRQTPNDADLSALGAVQGGTHERILRVLGLTSRPLQSGEIESALGLLANDARRAFEWLVDHGYISTVRGRTPAQRSPLWSLADKGRMWARGQGALMAGL
jgi:predicted ArsR family transcriptional regulator